MDRERAIRELRDGLEELRTEPLGEEEIMEMLSSVTTSASSGRRTVVAVAAAAIVLLAGMGLALLLTGGDEPLRFAAGPEVAGMEEISVSPPPLRVPPSASFDREEYRLLLEFRSDGIVTRLSYEPADGGARVRTTPLDEFPPRPRPKDVPADTLVAVAIAADADLPWRRVRQAQAGGPLGILYLTGTEPGRTLGAVAARVPVTPGQVAAMREVLRLGAAVTPRDLASAFPDDRVFQLRITREGGATRFRWGLDPHTREGERFGMGDESRTGAELAGGSGPALPSLAERMAGDGARPPRALVFLETGTGVSYLDVLRAVECLHGAWILDRGPTTMESFRLPEPLDAEDESRLVEVVGGVSPVFVNVDAEGRVRVKGVSVEPEAVDVPERAEVFLRADRRAPFAACRPIVEKALAGTGSVHLVFAPEDPEIPWERAVALPAADGAARTETIVLRPDATGAPEWREWTAPRIGPGTLVRLVVPADATAGDVLPAVLRLIRLGAAVRFAPD